MVNRGCSNSAAHLQCGGVGADEPLTALNETFLVAGETANFNDIASHAILKDPQGLVHGHTSRQNFNEIARLENDVRVPSLPRCFHCHGPFDQVKFTGDAVLLSEWEMGGFKGKKRQRQSEDNGV